MPNVVARRLCRVRKAADLRTAGLAIAASVVGGAAMAQTFVFDDVRLVGADRVDTATVLGTANIPAGQPITAGELNTAYQNVANAGLFETVEFVPEGNTLVIRVDEYPVVREISIEGNSRLSDEDLGEFVTSVPRRTFNPATAEADARAIGEAYRRAGRLGASVTPRIIRRADNQVDLVYEVREGEVVEIERISFVGNRAFSDRRLRGILATKQAGLLRQVIGSDTFIEERIGLDRQILTDFYRSRGYVDFRVDSVANEFSRERDAFFTQFNVTEGQQWRFGATGAVSQIAGVDASDYADVANIRQGSTYNPRAIENAIERMERLATRRGLPLLRATPRVERNPESRTLDVIFDLEEGPRIFVERIVIEGNSTTQDRVIRRQFDTVEGDPFNPREIRDAAERIRALNYFSDVAVETREGTQGPSSIIVDVDVAEQPTGSLSFGAAYSTDSGVGLNLGFSERNFLGRGQLLAAEISTGSNSRSAELTFGEPAFLGRDLAFRFSAAYQNTAYDQATYNTERIALSPSIAFPVSENGRLTLRYSLSYEDLQDIDEDASPILQREEGDAIVSSVGYTYSFDNRRSGLNPNAGFLFRFGQDFAGVGGDAQYVKTTALAAAQTRVRGDDIELTATLEGGALNPLGDYAPRVTDRFFLSSRQLRGFEPLGVGPRDLTARDEDPLGGLYYTALRLEAQFPIGIPEEYGITGGVFVDAGSLWGLEDTEGAEGEVDDDFAIRSVAGAAIFWDSPLGPLRFNFTETLQKEDYDEDRAFALTVSTSF